jgi:hypothetical protein
VADKRYYSNDSLTGLDGMRTCSSEPNWGRRNWKGKGEAQQPVYANRRDNRSQRGKALFRKRGE